MRAALHRLWPHARRGMAFNVMSKQVDRERDDLIHLSTDFLMAFLKTELSRHCLIRHDYGLYEYTAYVYRDRMSDSRKGRIKEAGKDRRDRMMKRAFIS